MKEPKWRHKNNIANQSEPPGTKHGQTYDSSCICNRGWPCWASMGGEDLGPLEPSCPSVGECQGREVGGSRWLGGGKASVGECDRGFQRGNYERG